MNILGVKIDNFSKDEIVRKANDFLNEDKFHQIATVNPEFILEARGNEEFRNILNQCDLNVADGVGIWFAFLRFGKYLKARMAGADLMEEILKIASINNYKIFLAASDRGLSSYEDTREAILKKYPNLTISGANIDCHSERSASWRRVEESNKKELDPSASLRSAQDDIEKISACDIIFCNFGAPYQEKFIYSLKNGENGSPHHLYPKSNNNVLHNNSLNDSSFSLQNQRCRGKIRLAMGVGGSFDYLTGKLTRAPLILRQIGLEWLWRLIQQPKRIKRIWNAVIIFPIKIIFSK